MSPKSVDSVVGDECGDALLEGCGTRSELSAEANAHEGDFAVIDFGKFENEVDDGGYDFFPVGAEDQAFAVEWAVLAGTVEGQDVVAAFDGGAGSIDVQFLCGAIEAGVHD